MKERRGECLSALCLYYVKLGTMESLDKGKVNPYNSEVNDFGV